jgi:beta-glucosidase
LVIIIQPLEAIQARAKQDHTSVSWHTLDWDTAGAKTRASNKDVAIVFINSDSGEGYLTVDGNRGDRCACMLHIDDQPLILLEEIT